MNLSNKQAPLFHRFSSVRVSAGALRGSGSSGWFCGRVLVLLVSRLVPLENERVPFPAMLQLLLCLLSALQPELHAEQRAPVGQSRTAASLCACSLHHHHHQRGRVESTHEDSLMDWQRKTLRWWHFHQGTCSKTIEYFVFCLLLVWEIECNHIVQTKDLCSSVSRVAHWIKWRHQYSHSDPRHSVIIYKQQMDLKEVFTVTFRERAVHKRRSSLDQFCFRNDSPNSVTIPSAIVEDAYIKAMSLGVSLACCSVVMRCIFPHGCCSVTDLCPVLPEVMSWSVHSALIRSVTKPHHTTAQLPLTYCSRTPRLLLTFYSVSFSP